MATTDRQYESVVEAVRQWPTELQFALLHEVLHVLAEGQPHRPTRASSEPTEADGRRRSTLAHATGLLKTSDSPPTDEEVRRLLEERRIEKFG